MKLPHLESLLAALHAGKELERPDRVRPLEGTRAHPFITISRQAGAGGRTMAANLVQRLNEIDPGERPWTTWDYELVHKVADEQHLPEDVINSLEESKPSWFQDMLGNLACDEDAGAPDEFKVYRRVAVTVRALADTGRAVIVGRGGVLITGDMPGGVHVRLVAPLDYRIAQWSRRFNVSEKQAAAAVHSVDQSRALFYKRHWPSHPLVPELFTLTLNTARIPEEKLADCVVPAIPVSAGTRRR